MSGTTVGLKNVQKCLAFPPLICEHHFPMNLGSAILHSAYLDQDEIKVDRSQGLQVLTFAPPRLHRRHPIPRHPHQMEIPRHLTRGRPTSRPMERGGECHRWLKSPSSLRVSCAERGRPRISRK
jgi:hypothetical protein